MEKEKTLSQTTQFQIKLIWSAIIAIVVVFLVFNYLLILKKISKLEFTVNTIYQENLAKLEEISQKEAKLKEAESALKRNLEIRAYTIEITNQGFSPIGFSAPTETKISITLKNFDKKEHSFTIDEFNVDTGLIEGSKETTLNFILPDKPQTLIFYSKGVKKDTPGFQGQIGVFRL